ncbi:hypothetical protein [Streptomyces sp. NPDC050600]|uniref:hypothetical protein n=1 Tax=Streptomyces sp. NPDC050600 TaxID=3157213 RepID=UPI003422B75E
MDKARLFENGTIGSNVFAHEIDAEPWWRRQKTPLICASCMTPMVSQRTSVGRNPRAPLFRLAKDRQHEEACPLNPVEVFQKIAHGSQGVAVIEGDELHLVLPDDLGQIGATTPATDTGPAGPGDRLGLDISTVRPLLPPLINSAVVIARFLQKHGYDPDVVAQFKVRRPGQTKAQAVGWDEFCHGPASDGHARLYTRLTDGTKPRHPVAVYGRITAVGTDSQDRPVLQLVDGRGFTVRIRSDHPSLLEPLSAGAFVLAVGAWKVWTPRTGRPELQLFAEEHWQLASWTYDDVTGRSSPPTCPPPLSLAQRTLRQARSAAVTRKPAPGRATNPSPRPRPNTPPTVATPPPTAPAPTPPPEAPQERAVPVTTDSSVPPMPASPPDPVVPAAQAPAPAPPAHPPVPPQPPAPPPPVVPPRRTRRAWWPFGRR